MEIPSDAKFRAISAAPAAWFSTKIAPRAPRLSATMATAPDPARRAPHPAPSTAVPKMLKTVSRRRSLKGRKAVPRKVCNRRLRYCPAITRNCPPSSVLLLAPRLGHRSELISPLAAWIERFEKPQPLLFFQRIVEQRKSFTAGQVEQFAIA